MKRALVISGGGSKGAWAGGVVQHLIQDDNNVYDMFVGTSTGSLMAPIIAINDISRLHSAYTSISSKDIFNLNPFKIKDKKTKIRIFAVAWNLFVKGQKTFGDSTKLLGLIKRFFKPEDFDEINRTGKEVICCVSNLTKQRAEYKSSKDVGYTDFCEWIQASSSFVPFMSLVEKDRCDYADGGIFDPIPIQAAIDRGADVIDVIILRTEVSEASIEKVRNAFGLITKVTDCMMQELGANDVVIGKLLSQNINIELNLHFLPKDLTHNPLEFNSDMMAQWWKEGYEHAKHKCTVTYKISNNRIEVIRETNT